MKSLRKCYKRTIELTLVIGLAISMIAISSNAISGKSSQFIFSADGDLIEAEPGGDWKDCKISQEEGSFPFFKRVCQTCKTKFTNFNVESTCWKSTED